MTNAHETDPLNSKTGHVPKKSRSRSRHWILVALALLLVGVAGQQVWTLRLWEGLNREKSTVVTVETRLETLEAALANQQQMHQEIDSMRQSLQQERALLQLDRIEERLDTGWQIWLATGDSKVLVTALKDGQIVMSTDPTSTGQALRLAMSHDLVEIKSQHMIDLRDSVEQLDGVIASIDKLPLIQDQRLQQSEPESVIVPVSQSEDTMMNKVRSIIAGLADELWQSIRGMVRVQRLDRAESALIAPEQRVFLQQGLRLVLLDARHSLVMRNTATYQQNLSQARAWIEKYCDVSNVLVKTDLARLQSLSELNIDPTVVSLEATRIALMAARAALLGEPLSISETSAANDAKPVNEAKPNGASE